MMVWLTRRATLLLPLLLAACGDDDVPAPTARRDYPPLRYDYLPPINLNVQRLEIAGNFNLPTGGDEIIGSAPVDPVATLNAMARDRLRPVAQGGIARFAVTTASVVRRRDAMNGVLAVRVDVHNADDTESGFAEARATATHSGAIPDQRAAVYDMLKAMMTDMNVELEYQLRNKLKAWVVDEAAARPPTAAPAPSAPVPVDPSTELPRPPAPPPAPRS